MRHRCTYSGCGLTIYLTGERSSFIQVRRLVGQRLELNDERTANRLGLK